MGNITACFELRSGHFCLFPPTVTVLLLYSLLQNAQIFPYEQLLISNFTLPAGVERMTVEVLSIKLSRHF